VEWWIVSPDADAPRNTGLVASLQQRGFNDASVEAWLPGNGIIFAGKQNDHLTLWRFQMSPDGRKMTSDPVRATSDDSGDYRASYSAGRLAFERTRVGLNLWSLPVDANQGRVTGDPQRLASTDAQKGAAAMSGDGKTLIYSAEQQGAFHLVLKDLTSGREKTVGLSNAFYSVLNRDGSQYIYGAGSKDAISVFTRAVSGWRSWWSRSICDRCGIPRGLSPDGTFLLVLVDTQPENHIDLVDVRTGKPRTVLKHWSHHFFGPELSPDGAWISFIAKTGDHSFCSYIARIPPDGITPENEWIRVYESSHEFQMAFWSPDGNLLYLLRQRGEGNLNWLDAQRLEAQSKRPAGEPFTIYHFKEPRVPTMDPIWNHPAAAGGRIVLELGDVSTNVWMMNLVP